jgi:hypothetical protein
VKHEQFSSERTSREANKAKTFPGINAWEKTIKATAYGPRGKSFF